MLEPFSTLVFKADFLFVQYAKINLKSILELSIKLQEVIAKAFVMFS